MSGCGGFHRSEQTDVLAMADLLLSSLLEMPVSLPSWSHHPPQLLALQLSTQTGSTVHLWLLVWRLQCEVPRVGPPSCSGAPCLPSHVGSTGAQRPAPPPLGEEGTSSCFRGQWSAFPLQTCLRELGPQAACPRGECVRNDTGAWKASLRPGSQSHRVNHPSGPGVVITCLAPPNLGN